MPTKEPRPASHFELRIGDKEKVGAFRKVTGLESTMDITVHHAVDANGRPYVRKVPGQQKVTEITLERGIDNENAIYMWHEAVKQKGPDEVRCDAQLSLLDYTGDSIVTINIHQAWPCSYKATEWDASTGNIAIESVVLAHEGFERV
jgi:phage tail-like protein